MKPDDIKFACICPTYNRPRMLPEAIESFQRQTHPHRELIIIDDANQYEPQEGDRWKLLTFPERFPFVYEKYSYGISCLSDCNAVAIWDDDDISLPDRLAVLATVLADGNDVACFSAICHLGECVTYRPIHFSYFHSGAYLMAAYHKAGGYPSMNSGGDQVIRNHFHFSGAKFGFAPLESVEYLYRWKSCYRHLSYNNHDSHEEIARTKVEKVEGKIHPHWTEDWDQLVRDTLDVQFNTAQEEDISHE